VVSDCNDNDELRNRFFALRTKYKLLKKSANTKIEELETELSRYLGFRVRVSNQNQGHILDDKRQIIFWMKMFKIYDKFVH
jgi:hypothetical protein